MESSCLNNQIYLLYADSNYELAMSFMRFQEFYESPNGKFRGKDFNHEEYMDWYAAENGNFTYSLDWSGFNLPDDVYNKAIPMVVHNDLWEKELELMQLVSKIRDECDRPQKYYILGASVDSPKDTAVVCYHEIAHAMWYLYPKYKKAQRENIKAIPEATLSKIKEILMKRGYGKNVILDEVQAYISTDTAKELRSEMKFPTIPNKKKFEKVYKTFLQETGVEEGLQNWLDNLEK